MNRTNQAIGVRWKGKGSEAKAQSEPMSQIVSQLRSSLIQSQARGLLSGSNVLVFLGPQEADLLNRACFGVPITTCSRDTQWFQLGPEEAYYLCTALKCLAIFDDNGEKRTSEAFDGEALWRHMRSEVEFFPRLYKAYSHLRLKNWVVTSGVRYGADFVAYRHHPGLVHSEFAVVVLWEGRENKRLAVWSDLHCAGRVCGGVAKTLLVLEVAENGCPESSRLCLEGYTVAERTISRWLPEQCREDRDPVRESKSNK